MNQLPRSVLRMAANPDTVAYANKQSEILGSLFLCGSMKFRCRLLDLGRDCESKTKHQHMQYITCKTTHEKDTYLFSVLIFNSSFEILGFSPRYGVDQECTHTHIRPMSQILYWDDLCELVLTLHKSRFSNYQELNHTSHHTNKQIIPPAWIQLCH